MLLSLLKMESWIQFNLEKVGKSLISELCSFCCFSFWLRQMVATANSSYGGRRGKGGKGSALEYFPQVWGEKNLGPLLIHYGVSFLFSNERNDRLNGVSHSFDFSFVLKIIVSQNHWSWNLYRSVDHSVEAPL